MKFVRFAFTLAALIFTSVRPVSADPKMEVSLSPARPVVSGAVTQLAIQLTWKTGEAGYRFSEPSIRADNLTIEAAGESNEVTQKNGESWNKKKYLFTLRAGKPGRGEILPFFIHFLDPATQKSGDLESPAIEIHITPDYAKMLKPVLLGLGGVAFLGLLTTVAILFKKKSSPSTILKIPSLEDRTLGSLHGQSPRKLEKILKGYLIEKYGLSLKASHRELLDGIREKLPIEDLKTLRRIFDKLEEFSFAQSATSVESGLVVNEIMQFIEGKKIIDQEDSWIQPSRK